MRYYTLLNREYTILNLSNKEEYLIFIIFRGFIISSSREVYIGNKLGNFIYSKSILILELSVVIVIILGY
jgi:hypothetical protein